MALPTGSHHAERACSKQELEWPAQSSWFFLKKAQALEGEQRLEDFIRKRWAAGEDMLERSQKQRPEGGRGVLCSALRHATCSRLPLLHCTP